MVLPELTETQKKIAAKIANKWCGIESLELQNWDSVDFVEIGKWQIERMIAEAYNHGLEAAIGVVEDRGNRIRGAIQPDRTIAEIKKVA